MILKNGHFIAKTWFLKSRVINWLIGCLLWKCHINQLQKILYGGSCRRGECIRYPRVFETSSLHISAAAIILPCFSHRGFDILMMIWWGVSLQLSWALNRSGKMVMESVGPNSLVTWLSCNVYQEPRWMRCNKKFMLRGGVSLKMAMS